MIEANAAAARPCLIFASVARTHEGARALNEDRFLQRPEIGLWAVADGMGGHQAGEVASSLLMDRLGGVGRHGSGYAYLNAVSDQLHLANRELLDHAAGMAPNALIGSTVVALLIHDGHAACVWAGDSRCYLRREGRLARLTRDHSLVQAMVDAGALTLEESRNHRRSNVITRAVGVADPLELDMHHAEVEPGDLFLLCSDGLTGSVEDAEIERLLDADDLDCAADDLMGLALRRGARDNVTLVLVRAKG